MRVSIFKMGHRLKPADIGGEIAASNLNPFINPTVI